MSGSTFRMGEGDWICGDSQCANINFARRTQCNRCGSEKSEALNKRKLGQEIGKAAAAKSHGLFSADDWQCNKCGNVNWARRQQCNVCNAPRFGDVEERTGLGGGYNDRGVVEYKQRDDSDDDYDEFGRRKKKLKKSGSEAEYKTNGKKSPKQQQQQQQQQEHEETDKEKRKKDEDDEDEDDDDEAEEADEDDDEEDDGDGDLSKYDLKNDYKHNLQAMFKDKDPRTGHQPRFKVNEGTTGARFFEAIKQKPILIRYVIGAVIGLPLLYLIANSTVEEMQFRRAERVMQVLKSHSAVEESKT